MPYKNPKSPEAIESMRAARKRHYYANKQQYALRNRAKKEFLQRILRELKDSPCLDCGIKYPYYVMQFDHIGTDKLTDVSTLIGYGSEKKLREEAAKCELVCANCHAERTHSRRQ